MTEDGGGGSESKLDGISKKSVDAEEFLDSMMKGLKTRGSVQDYQPGQSVGSGASLNSAKSLRGIRRSVALIDEKIAVKCIDNGVIDPKHPYKVYWDVLVGLLILYSVIVIPFRIGFDVEVSGSTLMMDWAIDLLFFVDILLSFNTAYYNDSNIMITDKNVIRWRYIRSWFLIDLVSTIPLDTIMQQVFGTSATAARSLRLIRIMRLTRLMKLARLARLARFIVLMEQVLDINPAVLQLGKVLGYILLLAHFYACGWYFIALPICPDADAEGNLICNEGLITDNWARFFGAWKFTIRSKYVVSLYYVITTMMGVGYGDIYAMSYQEMMYSIVMMISGSCCFGFILASVGVLFDTLDPRDRLAYQTVSELKDWMSFRELRKDLRKKIRNHYFYYLEKKDLLAEQPIAELLPEYLQSDLIKDIYSEKAASLRILRVYNSNDSVRFLSSVLRLMKPFFLAAEETVILTGEVPVDVFILVKGRIEAGCPWVKDKTDRKRQATMGIEDVKLLQSIVAKEALKGRKSFAARRRTQSVAAARERRASHWESQVLHAVFLTGDNFGQYHCLGARASEMMYMTVTPCDMLSLSREDMLALMDEFPAFAESVTESAKSFQQDWEELEKQPTVKHESTGRPCKRRILWRGNLLMLDDMTEEDVRGPVLEFDCGLGADDEDDGSGRAGSRVAAKALSVMSAVNLKSRLSLMGREMLHNSGRGITMESVVRTKRFDKERQRLVIEQELVADVVNRWIFPAQLPAKISWDIFMGVFILYTVLTVPFRLAFDVEVEGAFVVVEFGVDFLFFVDMMLSFRTAYDDMNDGSLVTVPSMIAKRYLKSHFLVDLLSTIPLDSILRFALESDQGVIGLKMIRILRLGRLFKLSRLLKMTGIIDSLKKKIDVSSVIIRIVELIFQLSFVAHYAACAFYYAGYQVQNLEMDACDMGNLWCVPGTRAKVWYETVARPFDMHTPTERKYITSMYWAFTTLCTVGYGDIAGTTFAERMVAIVVMFMGVSMYSYIGGSISSLVSNGNSISSLFKKQSNMLRQSLDAIKKNVDPALTNRIVQQCEHVWRIRTETDQKYLSELPTDIRNETILYIHRTYTPYISIVSDTPKLAKWLSAPIVQQMTPELINKGQKLEMWSGHILYFVTSGAFQLEVVDEGDIVEKQPVYYFRGDTFGFEFAPTAPRSRPPEFVVCNKSMRVVALEDTQVFGLSRHDVASLIKCFPSAATIIKSRIHEAIQKTAERQFLNGEHDWRDVVAKWAPEPDRAFASRAARIQRINQAPPVPPVPENPLAQLPPLTRSFVRPQSGATSIETREYFPFVIEDL